MLKDKQLEFSSEQAITATAASTNYLDLGAAVDLGIGEKIGVIVTCTAAMTDSSSNSTVTVTLEGDSTTTFTPDASFTVGSFAALSAVGTTIAAVLPLGVLQYRYLQLKYTVANGDLTTGSFTAFLAPIDYGTSGGYVAYADAVTITG